jgi:hypothetical protein
MNYLYRRLLWESDFEETTELRSEFRRHLVLVAGALMDIEWVDSGDLVPGDEDESIAVVLGSTSRGQKMRDAGYTRRPTLREMAEPECKGIPRPGCNYLATCNTVCNKCGKVHAVQESVAWGVDWSDPSCCTIIKHHPDGVKEVVAVEYSPPRHDKELLEALKDAADAIEHWGAYVPDYFQSKHDLEADIDRARGVVAKVEESTK